MRLASFTVIVRDRDGRRLRRFETIGTYSAAMAAGYLAAEQCGGVDVRATNNG